MEQMVETDRWKGQAAEGKEPFPFKTVPHGAATSVWATVITPAEGGGRTVLRELPRE